MSDIFQNSISGLLAFQRALATTSHNIANVNTEGFSRQRVELGTRTAGASGNGFLGSGVEANSIRRIFDQSRQTAVEQNTAEFRRLDTIAGLARRIDDLVADQSAGLSPAMQGFFNGVQDVANDPSSSTARQALLTAGENLAGRLRFLDQRFASIGEDVDAQLRYNVAEVNQLADGFASLNEAILSERGRTGGQPPNDLLDQRDRLVTELSGKVGNRVVEQDDGSLNVFIGNGQTLVAGFNANRLEVVPGAEDPARAEIRLATDSGQGARITGTLQGGDLGGLLDFRREILQPTRNELGRVAASVALSINAQQNLGLQFDLGAAGQLGDDFLRVGEPKVIPRPGNTGGSAVSAQFAADAPSGLKASDYRLRYDGTNWSITRLSDNTQTPVPSFPMTLDGLEIDIESGTPAAGDSFLIQPTRNVAQGLEVALTRPSQIAAAAPLAAAEATDETGQALNRGTSAISGLQVSTTDGLPLPSGVGPITLTYDAANDRYDVTGANGLDYGSIGFDPATDAGGLTVGGPDGANYTAGAGSLTDIGAVEFTLSGNPQDRDSFVNSANSNARGDNSNALALGQLADSSILNGGEATFQEAYASLVGDVGTSTLRAEVNRDAQESVLNQAKAAREAVSGVNLNEEAANLLKFQQAYQASAQAISIANSLFDSLLSAVRR